MKLGRLNHVGVATWSLNKAIAFWRDPMRAGMIRSLQQAIITGENLCVRH